MSSLKFKLQLHHKSHNIMINYNGIHYLLIEFAFTRILGPTFSLSFLNFWNFFFFKKWDFICLIFDVFASALLRIGNYAPECVFLFVSLHLYIVLFVRQSFNSHSMLHVIRQCVTPTGTFGLGSSLRTWDNRSCCSALLFVLKTYFSRFPASIF